MPSPADAPGLALDARRLRALLHERRAVDRAGRAELLLVVAARAVDHTAARDRDRRRDGRWRIGHDVEHAVAAAGHPDAAAIPPPRAALDARTARALLDQRHARRALRDGAELVLVLATLALDVGLCGGGTRARQQRRGTRGWQAVWSWLMAVPIVVVARYGRDRRALTEVPRAARFGVDSLSGLDHWRSRVPRGGLAALRAHRSRNTPSQPWSTQMPSRVQPQVRPWRHGARERCCTNWALRTRPTAQKL